MSGYGVSKTPMYLFEGLARGHRTAIGSLSLAYGDEVILGKDQVEKYGVRKMVREKKIAYRGQIDDTDSRVGSRYYDYVDGLAGAFSDNAVVINTMMADTAVDTANRLAWIDCGVDRMIGLQKAMVNATAWPSPNNGATIDLDNRVQFLLAKTVNRDVVKITSGVSYVAATTTYADLTLGSNIGTLSNLGAAGDYIYLGDADKFSHLYCTGTLLNTNVVTLSSVEYWNGTAWVAFDTVTDMTQLAGATLGQSGFIAWYETPDDWVKTTVGTIVDKYWVRLDISGALDANTTFYFNVLGEEPLIPMEVLGYDESLLGSVEFENNTTVGVLDYTATNSITDWIAAEDALYLGFTKPVAGVLIDQGTTDQVELSVMSGQYWNGGAWAAATITDNTADGGATLGQNGTITWAVPAIWVKGTAADIFGGEGTTDLYWIKLVVTANLTVNLEIDAIYPLVAPYSIQEYEAPKGGMLQPSEKLKLYVGEVEALADALSNIEVKIVGFSL